MIEIVRSNAANADFIELVKMLDADLAKRDGADHTFYARFNKTDALRHVVIAYELDQAVGCGAMKPFSLDAMEIKRMYTLPEKRGKGVAAAILAELEKWAAELSYSRTVLETGKRQPEA